MDIVFCRTCNTGRYSDQPQEQDEQQQCNHDYPSKLVKSRGSLSFKRDAGFHLNNLNPQH